MRALLRHGLHEPEPSWIRTVTNLFCEYHRDPIPTCSQCNPPSPGKPRDRRLTQYVVLHRSCAGHPGVLAAQTIHAAGESIRARSLPPSSTYAVALVADTSADLEQLSEVLRAEGIHHALIHEPDAPYNGAATAVGIEPMERDFVRPFVSHLKVLR